MFEHTVTLFTNNHIYVQDVEEVGCRLFMLPWQIWSRRAVPCGCIDDGSFRYHRWNVVVYDLRLCLYFCVEWFDSSPIYGVRPIEVLSQWRLCVVRCGHGATYLEGPTPGILGVVVNISLYANTIRLDMARLCNSADRHYCDHRQDSTRRIYTQFNAYAAISVVIDGVVRNVESYYPTWDDTCDRCMSGYGLATQTENEPNCSRIVILEWAAYEGNLDNIVRLVTKRHLADCYWCRALLQRICIKWYNWTYSPKFKQIGLYADPGFWRCINIRCDRSLLSGAIHERLRSDTWPLENCLRGGYY
ncbi:hypothetical protein [Changjiang astro-like virus]|uniref:hypothetical protein n=1 Tax=Changjiang astro-like virus TaxID=1922764 RepID=UPI00090942BA|nr:hypothetical protein [Changjiang astro-like virus]APG79036.1 hypothetical protein [Changjiang astro-like virus]